LKPLASLSGKPPKIWSTPSARLMKALWTGRESFKPRPGSHSSVRTRGIFAREMPRFKTPKRLSRRARNRPGKPGIRSAEVTRRARRRSSAPPASPVDRLLVAIAPVQQAVARDLLDCAFTPLERQRVEGQGEMLLPISGKKGKDAVAKPAERTSARQKKAG